MNKTDIPESIIVFYPVVSAPPLYTTKGLLNLSWKLIWRTDQHLSQNNMTKEEISTPNNQWHRTGLESVAFPQKLRFLEEPIESKLVRK